MAGEDGVPAVTDPAPPVAAPTPSVPTVPRCSPAARPALAAAPCVRQAGTRSVLTAPRPGAPRVAGVPRVAEDPAVAAAEAAVADKKCDDYL